MPLGRRRSRPQTDARHFPALAFLPILRRAALSCILTTALLLVATASLQFTTAPAWLSLLVEPLNLIFAPALFVAMLGESSHDYNTAHVFHASVVFYLVLTYLLLWDRDHRQQSKRRLAQQNSNSV